jgi:hypothetical protein
MYRNKPDQFLRVFAFAKRALVVNGSAVHMADPVPGIANTISLRLSKNGGQLFNASALNPIETESGYYLHPLSQSETDADTLDPYPASSIDGVQVIAVNYDRQLVVDFADKINLIGTNEARLSQPPVTVSGEFSSPLVLGDDYFGERAFQWTIISAVETPVACKLGFYLNAENNFILDGEILSNGDGSHVLRFESTSEITATLSPGKYEYSLDTRDEDGNKMTRFHSHFYLPDGSEARNYVRFVQRRTGL